MHTAGYRWQDEGDLSTSEHAYSNATCLWQKILWADGYLTNDGIDGIFGGGTASATLQWEADRALPHDGKVGINAFKKADAKLKSDQERAWYYDGSEHDAVITFDDDGRFGFYEDGVHRLAGYNYRTCS
ncbi:hypothetical protein [Saccharothrix sp. ALI-22-I]|uniref:hypothetical protein n=1 Tax=Saccharothrix sp. ALI-22-I TaxID=1933778 RepID=UPI0009FE693D|nr:hypothetical protein [Saccharothrix sp. ALI-22-I]